VAIPEPGEYDLYVEVDREVFDLIKLHVRRKA
jgi:hypothetical protein